MTLLLQLCFFGQGRVLQNVGCFTTTTTTTFIYVAYSVYVIPFILSPECYIISLHCPTNPNVCRDASRTFEYLHKV